MNNFIEQETYAKRFLNYLEENIDDFEFLEIISVDESTHVYHKDVLVAGIRGDLTGDMVYFTKNETSAEFLDLKNEFNKYNLNLKNSIEDIEPLKTLHANNEVYFTDKKISFKFAVTYIDSPDEPIYDYEWKYVKNLESLQECLQNDYNDSVVDIPLRQFFIDGQLFIDEHFNLNPAFDIQKYNDMLFTDEGKIKLKERNESLLKFILEEHDVDGVMVKNHYSNTKVFVKVDDLGLPMENFALLKSNIESNDEYSFVIYNNLNPIFNVIEEAKNNYDKKIKKRYK